MKAARWGEIKSVLATVLDTDPTERIETLDRLCRDDAELHAICEATYSDLRQRKRAAVR